MTANIRCKLIDELFGEELVIEYVKRLAFNKRELESIISKSNQTNSRIIQRLAKDIEAQQHRVNSLTSQQENLINSLANLGPKGIEAVKEKLETVRNDLEAARQELELMKLESRQLESRTIDAEVMSNTLDRFSQIIDGAQPSELQKLLPTVVKGIEWTEDSKSGEGILEVYLWEEAQKAMGNVSPLTKKTSGEPLVVNGSPECQDTLPELDSNQ